VRRKDNNCDIIKGLGMILAEISVWIDNKPQKYFEKENKLSAFKMCKGVKNIFYLI
jgi:hypothetical protein